MSLRIAGAAWLALLGLTLALTVLAAGHDTLPGDLRLTTWAQGLAFPGESLADIVRAASGTEVVLASGGAIAVALWLRGYRRQAALLAAGLVVLPLLQFAIKEAVDRPRPSPELVELRAGFSSPSFPSGHVMGSSYLYVLLLYLAVRLPLPSWPRGLIAAWCVLVLAFAGPANVYLGVHWPSDVLGGYAWGLLLATPLAAFDFSRSRPAS